jgi:hypothetical protein
MFMLSPRQAFALLGEMKDAGLDPNVVTYTTLVDALCRDGQVRCLRGRRQRG